MLACHNALYHRELLFSIRCTIILTSALHTVMPKKQAQKEKQIITPEQAKDMRLLANLILDRSLSKPHAQISAHTSHLYVKL